MLCISLYHIGDGGNKLFVFVFVFVKREAQREKSAPPSSRESPLKISHTAPAAPFVLHRTSIGKGAMKTFRINCQWMMRPLDESVPWKMRPLDDASLGWRVPWTRHPFANASCGRCVPWTMHPMDDASFRRRVKRQRLVKHKHYVYFQKKIMAAYVFLCHDTKLCKCN